MLSIASSHNPYLQMTPQNFADGTDYFFGEPSPACEWAEQSLDNPSCSNLYNEFLLPYPEDAPVLDPPSEIIIMPKEEHSTSESQQYHESQAIMVSSAGQRKSKTKQGCRCKSRNCQQNYCRCFRQGRQCTDKCRCIKCKCNKQVKQLFCLAQHYCLEFFNYKYIMKGK